MFQQNFECFACTCTWTDNKLFCRRPSICHLLSAFSLLLSLAPKLPGISGLGRKQDNDGAAEPIRWEDISLGRLPKVASVQWIDFGLPRHSGKPKMFFQGKGLWNQQRRGNAHINIWRFFVFICIFHICCVIVWGPTVRPKKTDYCPTVHFFKTDSWARTVAGSYTIHVWMIAHHSVKSSLQS